jgi:hypothetical protein
VESSLRRPTGHREGGHLESYNDMTNRQQWLEKGVSRLRGKKKLTLLAQNSAGFELCQSALWLVIVGCLTPTVARPSYSPRRMARVVSKPKSIRLTCEGIAELQG